MDFRVQRRAHATHASGTDPQAKLYRKGSRQGAVLGYLGHVLLDNRHGLVAGAYVTRDGAGGMRGRVGLSRVCPPATSRSTPTKRTTSGRPSKRRGGAVIAAIAQINRSTTASETSHLSCVFSPNNWIKAKGCLTGITNAIQTKLMMLPEMGGRLQCAALVLPAFEHRWQAD